MSDTNTGINGSSIPAPPAGIKYGHYTPNEAVTKNDLTCSLLPNVTQHWSMSIGRDYHIYQDFGHGNGTYLVIYIETGMISPGELVSSQYLTGGDRDSGRSGDLAKGFFHHRIDTSVQPSINGDGTSMPDTSPSTLNRSMNVNNQIVSSVTETLTVGGDSEGMSGSASDSTSTQTWKGESFNITDWDVEEHSDAGAKKAAWTYFQTTPWDGRNDVSSFGNWWSQAYSCGGGWDNVYDPCELSRSVLKYTNIVAWRFNKDLVVDGKLNVTFSGNANAHLICISMPQLQGQGNHHQHSYVIPVYWNDTLDLVAWANKI